ncbi:MAG: hypothetical protein U0T83_08245 [Bacteriovoracaceae bacterium]
METVKIILNHRAGCSDQSYWKSEIEKILFRRELHFVSPRNLYELHAEVQDAITKNMNLLISVEW